MSIKLKLSLLMGFFTSLILTIVAVTFWTINSQKDDATIINMAGRQRMLTQKFTKEVFNEIIPQQIRYNTLKAAEIATIQIKEDRKKYAKDVVGKLQKEWSGVRPARNWKDIKGGIPLPATFIQEVSEIINKMDWYRYDLISKWNINKKKGLTSQFEKDAFESIMEIKDKPYLRYIEYRDQFVLRYATADIASSQTCVDCHNSLPQSEKRDFKQGDLMGILIVTIPITPEISIGKTLFSQDNFKVGKNAYRSTKKVFERTMKALIEGGEAPIDLAMTEFVKISSGNIPKITLQLEKVGGLWDRMQKTVHEIKTEKVNSPAYLTAVVKLQDINLDVQREMNKAVAMFEEISKKRLERLKVIQIVFLFVTVAAFCFVWILLKRIVITPINGLSTAVAEMGKGDLKEIDIPHANDEIGQLTDSFNRMVSDLQKTMVSRDYMDKIIHSMSDMLFVVSPEANILTINKTCCDLLGYEEKELAGKPISTIFAKEEFKKSGIEDLIKKGFISNVEKTFVTKDQKTIPALFSGSVMRDDGGKIQGIVCVAVDIAERKKAGEELEKSEEQLRAITSSVNDAIIMIDSEGKVLFWNPAAQEMFGFSPGDIIGKDLSKFIIPEKYREGHTKGLSAFKNTGRGPAIGKIVQLEGLRKNGEEFPIELSLSSIKHKATWHAIGVIHDITERKQAEAEKQRMQVKMVSSSKLATLGEISTGVAHEINQPLTYISSLIQGLKRDIKENSIDEAKLEEKLKFASGQVERIISIINHLRTFGRQYDVSMEEVDLGSILENTLLLLGERIRLRNIKLTRSIEENLPMVWGTPNQLEQVFINLFQNAIDAFGDKKENAEIRVDISILDKRKKAQIKFTDNGPGMEESTREKIFEPFFTTKEVGKGTGLGLSIVYGIIRDHKGDITCESVKNKGTTFTITMPLDRRKPR